MPVLWKIRSHGETRCELRDYEKDTVTVVAQPSVKLRGGDRGARRSLSNGVHPKQIPQAKRLDAIVGAPYTEYDSVTGDALFSSAQHERDWLKAHQRVNRNAGYRDPCPGDFAGKRDELLAKIDRARRDGRYPDTRYVLPFPEE